MGKVRLPSRLIGFTRACLANAAEVILREIPASKYGVEVAVPPYAIVTVRLMAGTGSAPPK